MSATGWVRSRDLTEAIIQNLLKVVLFSRRSRISIKGVYRELTLVVRTI